MVDTCCISLHNPISAISNQSMKTETRSSNLFKMCSCPCKCSQSKPEWCWLSAAETVNTIWPENEKQIGANKSKQTSNACFPSFSMILFLFYVSGVISLNSGRKISHHSLWRRTNQTLTRACCRGVRASGEIHSQNKAISGRSHTCSQFPRTKSIQDEWCVLAQLETLCKPIEFLWRQETTNFLGYLTKQTPVPAFHWLCVLYQFNGDVLPLKLAALLSCFVRPPLSHHGSCDCVWSVTKCNIGGSTYRNMPETEEDS